MAPFLQILYFFSPLQFTAAKQNVKKRKYHKRLDIIEEQAFRKKRQRDCKKRNKRASKKIACSN